MKPVKLFKLSDLVDLSGTRNGKRISSPFGQRVHPISGRKSFHNGIDIRCARGSSLYCPVDGAWASQLLRSEERRQPRSGNGRALIWYCPVPGQPDAPPVRIGMAHLSSVEGRIFQLLNAGRRPPMLYGEKLGETGNTGGSTGPHLHLTVKVDGKFVDPALWLDID